MQRNFVFSQTVEWLLVTLLVLIGGYIRFANFSGSLAWTNDIARDFLEARQIATTQTWETQGHFNTGTNGSYPPYYFNFLGLLHMIGGSIEFTYGYFILWQTIALIGLYLLGKYLFNWQTGLVVLLVAIFSRALIDIAHYPAPMTWSLPLNFLSLLLVALWWRNRKVRHLWFAAVVSFLALQIHGTQLVWLAIVMGFLSLTLWQKFRRRQLTGREFFDWTVLVALILNSQQALLAKILNTNSDTIDFTWERVQKIETLLAEVFITDFGVGYFFIALFSLFSIWWLLKLQDKQLLKWRSWVLYLIYPLVFEVFLAGLGTSVLIHHQYYLIPIVIVLISGWIVNLPLPGSKLLGFGAKFCLITLLIYVMGIHTTGFLTVDGNYALTQRLYQKMKQAELPLKTATVVMTDAASDRLEGTTSSTELWWFLVTDLGRDDLDAQSRKLDFGSEQLIIVCDQQLSQLHHLDCSAQQSTVLRSTGYNFRLERTMQFDSQYEVKVYRKFYMCGGTMSTLRV